VKEQPIPIPEVFERARKRERWRESKRETDIGDSHRGIAGNTLTPHDHAVALSRWQASTYIHTRLYHGYLASIDNSYRKLQCAHSLGCSSPTPRGCRYILSRGIEFPRGFLPSVARSAASLGKNCRKGLVSPHCSLPFSRSTFFPLSNISTFPFVLALRIELSFDCPY